MPANLNPVYLAAEAEFRAATDSRTRIEALERMLRVIPKHKGTDHLRGSLRKKLSQLREDQQKERKTGKRADPSHVPPQGAGQVVLLGPPNSGKSSLLAALTNADPQIGPYPFTTGQPLPGMMQFENVQIQLVDCPPVSKDRYDGWMSSLVRRANAVLFVVDPSDPDTLDDIDAICDRLETSKIRLVGFWGAEQSKPEDETPEGELADELILARLEPGSVELPTILLATKQDVQPRKDDTDALDELLENRFPIVGTSVENPQSLESLPGQVFEMLGVMRVYTKPPGKAANMDEPNIIAAGSTVQQLARTIHKDLAKHLSYARIWATGYHPGQRLARDQVLRDGDVVELHD